MTTQMNVNILDRSLTNFQKSHGNRDLSNQELNQNLKNLASQERKLTKMVIEHIAEVDARKLYLSMAYPSLFEYLVKEIGYSASAAQRRLDAARLFRLVPDLGLKIEAGKIHLNQITQVQKTFRQISKSTGASVPTLQKQNLLLKIENKSSRETDLILAQEFSLPAFIEEKNKIQKDESVRIEFTLTKEEYQLLNQVKALLSHSLKNLETKTLMLHLVNKFLQSRKVQKFAEKKLMKVSRMKASSANPLKIKAVSTKTKRIIFTRDQHCQYVDPKSKRKCSAKYFLQIDHIKPRWANGENDCQNLQLLCSQHNKFRYRLQVGFKKMKEA